METTSFRNLKIETSKISCVLQKRLGHLYVTPMVISKKGTKFLNLKNQDVYETERQKRIYGTAYVLTPESVEQLEKFAPIKEIGRFAYYCNQCAWEIFKSGNVFEKEKYFRRLVLASKSFTVLSVEEILELSEEVERILNLDTSSVVNVKIKTPKGPFVKEKEDYMEKTM